METETWHALSVDEIFLEVPGDVIGAHGVVHELLHDAQVVDGLRADTLKCSLHTTESWSNQIYVYQFDLSRLVSRISLT
jgi:hypothetical protein